MEREESNMKKILVLLMTMLLVLGLAACGGPKTPETSAPTVPSTAATTAPTEPTTVPTTAPTEPNADALVGGVDLTGLTLEQASAALTEAAAKYNLALTVNGTKLNIAAADISLALDQEALPAYLTALEQGTEVPASLFTYDRAALKSLLGGKLDTAPKNATISFSSSKNQFTAVDGSNGVSFDLDAAADAAAAALGLLNPAAEAQVKTTSIAPEITASGDKVKNALS